MSTSCCRLRLALRTAGQQFATTEPIELVRLRIQRLGVRLVGDTQHRLIDVAQPLGDFLIQGSESGAGVDDEQDHIRRLDARGDLIFDLLGQIVGVFDSHPARIDQLKKAAIDIHQVRHAIARDSGHVVDNGQTSTGQPIEDAGFAHVRTTDNDDLGNLHDTDAAQSKRNTRRTGRRLPQGISIGRRMDHVRRERRATARATADGIRP